MAILAIKLFPTNGRKVVMENVLVPQNSLFQNKLNKWQWLAVIVTLVAFFIAMHFTADKEKAVAFTLFIITIVALISLAAAALVAFAALVTSIVALIFIFVVGIGDILVVGIVVIAALTAILVIADGAKEYSIRKKVIWFSFAAEFVCINLPILLTH